ncbi:MAG: NUDIX hydrolase, partial [Myxococcales bacterium]
MPVDMRWKALDAQLAAHPSADEKEARDVAFVRAFLRAHPTDAHLRSQLEGHLTGSGFVLDSSRKRVLLLHHKKLERWLQPGGHGEGETDPRLVALREIEEETGLTAKDLQPFPDDKLLDVDVHRIPARTRKGDTKAGLGPGHHIPDTGDTKAGLGPGHHVPDTICEPAHDHLDLRYGFVARVGVEP